MTSKVARHTPTRIENNHSTNAISSDFRKLFQNVRYLLENVLNFIAQNILFDDVW